MDDDIIRGTQSIDDVETALRSSLHTSKGLAELLAERVNSDDRQLADTLMAETGKIEILIDELLTMIVDDTAESSAGAASVVWVVDDSPVNRLLTKSQLERLGHESVACASGVEALERRRRGELPDLVLLDWHMPELDGLETAQRFRELEAELSVAPVPIVALTARAMPGDRERCLAAGMNDFLAKPISLRDLDVAVETWAASRI